MSTIDTVEQHLISMGLEYRRRDRLHIEIGFEGTNNPSWLVLISEWGPWLTYTVPVVDAVPESRHAEVARLANLLNATRLAWGAFWLRPQYGQLCFEAGMPAQEGPSRDQVSAVRYPTSLVDYFYPAFMRVIWAGDRADDALAWVSAGEVPQAADAGPDSRPSNANDAEPGDIAV